MSRFPNAIAISGHSHYSLTDERQVWQGDFTSIGAGSLRFAFALYWRENGEDHNQVVKQMPCLYEGTSHGMFIRLFDDRMVIERREYVLGEKLGPDWEVPLDGRKEFAFANRKAKAVAPEFEPGAQVELSVAKGKNRKGVETDQITVSFPAARPSSTSRVLDYEVRAIAFHEDQDYAVLTKRVLAEKFYLPVSREAPRGKCVFALSELPETELVFEVRPVECYGNKGRAIVSKPWRRGVKW